MKIDRVIVGELEENCYVLHNGNHVLIIDPGDEYDKIMQVVGDAIIDGILITHHHSDHIGALSYFKGISVFDYYNIKNYDLKLFPMQPLNTPGHSHDSMSYIFDNESVVFTGDFLFKGDVGRCDFRDSSPADMKISISKIKALPDNYKVYPGHGDMTSLDYEQTHNPFF